MARLGEANIGGRMVPAWLLDLTAEELDGLKWYSNPNLLDNWYFPQAVNQRGETSWSGRGHHLDRWYEEQGVAGSIGEDGYHIGTGQIVIQKHSEEEMNQLLGKTVTVSCLLSDGSFATATGTIPHELTKNFNIVCHPKSGVQFMFSLFYSAKSYQFGRFQNSASGSEITVVACKTELGSHQTLAYQDENGNWHLKELPDYGEELAKCQRYLLPLLSDLVPASVIGTGSVFFFIPTPVEMRVVPSIALNNFVVRSISGNNQTGFTFSVSSVRSNGVFVSATKANHGLDSAMISAGASPGTLLSAEL